MTSVKLVKLKFKPGSRQIWLDWAEELKRRKSDVVATLKDEGVVSESCFISKDGEEVFYFMEAIDLAKAKEAFLKSTHPIDADHRKVQRSSLEFVGDLDCLFHFDNRD